MNNKGKRFTRREFIHFLNMAGAGAILAACQANTLKTALPEQAPQASRPTAGNTDTPTQTEVTQPEPTMEPAVEQPTGVVMPDGDTYLAVVHGEDAEAITMAAIMALGGMEKFVRSGNDVIIKPNICTDYHTYEYAATTNPFVVAALVKMCLAAGAKRVRVMDNPFGGSTESAYQRSGIADAVISAGGEMEIMNRNKYRAFPIPAGVDLRDWEFYAPILEADLVINVPIAKTHGLARLTLGGKNLLGVISRPSAMHSALGQRVADLTSRVAPALTVIDAVRILTGSGPTGGDLNDVKMTNQVIASRDIVAADAFAAGLFGLKGSDISYIQASADMGLGTMDLESIKIEEFSV